MGTQGNLYSSLCSLYISVHTIVPSSIIAGDYIVDGYIAGDYIVDGCIANGYCLLPTLVGRSLPD